MSTRAATATAATAAAAAATSTATESHGEGASGAVDTTFVVLPFGSVDDSRPFAANAPHHIRLRSSLFDEDGCDETGSRLEQASASNTYNTNNNSIKNNNYTSFQLSNEAGSDTEDDGAELYLFSNARWWCIEIPSTRKIALSLSLYLNVAILVWKLIAYLQTHSLSVLAALLDSVLDVVSQIVLNYTEQHSSMQRSSAFYPAGASRLEPVGVLTCAALMGMASFEVLKESGTALAHPSRRNALNAQHISSVYGMVATVFIKLGLLWLCRRGANKRRVFITPTATATSKTGSTPKVYVDDGVDTETVITQEEGNQRLIQDPTAETIADTASTSNDTTSTTTTVVLAPLPSRAATALATDQLADPTLEALAQDHFNDCLSNGVAAVALLCVVRDPRLWFLDPVGAIIISVYIIYSWFTTGKEQIEHLTGKSAPEEFIEELVDLANEFDDRLQVDTIRAYHFGPKFLVEIEIVMDAATLLFESHDLGMDLQYEIEGREEVERCFVHIDYQARPYDEHVVSKVPAWREQYMKQLSDHKLVRSAQSV